MAPQANKPATLAEIQKIMMSYRAIIEYFIDGDIILNWDEVLAKVAHNKGLFIDIANEETRQIHVYTAEVPENYVPGVVYTS